jgi:hypothetical protein
VILGRCVMCDEPVDDRYPYSRRVVGWEALRDGKGGANRIIDRMPLGHLAHTHCAERRADRRRRGIHDDQGALL